MGCQTSPYSWLFKEYHLIQLTLMRATFEDDDKNELLYILPIRAQIIC